MLTLCPKCKLPDHNKKRRECKKCFENEWCDKKDHEPKCSFDVISEPNDWKVAIQNKFRRCLCCRILSYSLTSTHYCRSCTFIINRKLHVGFNIAEKIESEFQHCRECKSDLIFKPCGLEQESPFFFYNWDFDREIFHLRKLNYSADDIVQHFRNSGGLLCIDCRNLITLVQDQKPFTCFQCNNHYVESCLKRRWKKNDLCIHCYYDSSIQNEIAQLSSMYTNQIESCGGCNFDQCPFCFNKSNACQFDHNNMFVYSHFDYVSSPGMGILLGAPSSHIMKEMERSTPICHRAHQLTSFVEMTMGYFSAKRAYTNMKRRISTHPQYQQRLSHILTLLQNHYTTYFGPALKRATQTYLTIRYEKISMTILPTPTMIEQKDKVCNICHETIMISLKKHQRNKAVCPDCNIEFCKMKSLHRGYRRNRCPLIIPHTWIDWDSLKIPLVLFDNIDNDLLFHDFIKTECGFNNAMIIMNSIGTTDAVVQKRNEWDNWYFNNYHRWKRELRNFIDNKIELSNIHRRMLVNLKRKREY